LHYRALDYLI